MYTVAYLELGVGNTAELCVPPSALHEQAVDVSALPWRRSELLLLLLGHVALQAHLVQGPLVLACCALHDGCQERLRVEEPGQPHG